MRTQIAARASEILKWQLVADRTFSREMALKAAASRRAEAWNFVKEPGDMVLDIRPPPRVTASQLAAEHAAWYERHCGNPERNE